MRTRAIVFTVAAFLSIAACSSDNGATPAPQTVTVTPTTASNPGADIAAKADQINGLINKGCGEAPKPTCAESGAQLTAMVDEARALMAAAPDPTFYSEALAIADRVKYAGNSTSLRATVIDFAQWISEHPTA